jgi:hypothetical protein
MPILFIKGVMKSLIFHSPVMLFISIAVFVGIYMLLIWLMGGFLSFAKQTPNTKLNALRLPNKGGPK